MFRAGLLDEASVDAHLRPGEGDGREDDEQEEAHAEPDPGEEPAARTHVEHGGLA